MAHARDSSPCCKRNNMPRVATSRQARGRSAERFNASESSIDAFISGTAIF